MTHSISDYRKEFIACMWALAFIFIQLIILGLAYGFSYDSSYMYPYDYEQKKNYKLHAIDIITICGTIMILLFSFVYWRIFYYGNFLGCIYSDAIKTHATEAYPMYTALYTFGIGLLMPILKYIISRENYAQGMYPFYPIVFLCMLSGYYSYELIKIRHYFTIFPSK